MPSSKPVISLRLDPDLRIVVESHAERMRVSLSAFVQSVLREALGVNRLANNGVSVQPVFGRAPSSRADLVRMSKAQAVAKNAPCPCGSGKKFKRCCGQT